MQQLKLHINQISFNNLFSFKLQVMAKVEELNKSMGPAYRIADQVKDIKKLHLEVESKN